MSFRGILELQASFSCLNNILLGDATYIQVSYIWRLSSMCSSYTLMLSGPKTSRNTMNNGMNLQNP